VEQPTYSTFWDVIQTICTAALAGISGIVVYLWRQLSKVDSIDQRVTAVENSLEEIHSRQQEMGVEQNDQKLLLVEMKTDVKWVREAVEEIKHKLDK